MRMAPPEQALRVRALETLVWISAWTVLALALVGSLTPQEPAEPSFSDKVTHALGYTALCSLFLLAAVWLPLRGPGRFPSSAGAVMVAIAAVGVVIEILQGFVGRTVDVLDVAANMAGCLCGRFLWGVLRGALSERPL
jgi:VanZ family protein